jgi:hypothetical protein
MADSQKAGTSPAFECGNDNTAETPQVLSVYARRDPKRRSRSNHSGSIQRPRTAAEVPQTPSRSAFVDLNARVRPVPAAGFEPARTFVQRFAGPPRLPFSPRRHIPAANHGNPEGQDVEPHKCCRPRAIIGQSLRSAIIETTPSVAALRRNHFEIPAQSIRQPHLPRRAALGEEQPPIRHENDETPRP